MCYRCNARYGDELHRAGWVDALCCGAMAMQCDEVVVEQGTTGLALKELERQYFLLLQHFHTLSNSIALHTYPSGIMTCTSNLVRISPCFESQFDLSIIHLGQSFLRF